MSWKDPAVLPLVAVSSMSAVVCCASPARPENPVNAVVREAMDTMIQDEYRAENTYLRVLSDFGEVRPFSNIVRAEQRHSAAIAALYEARGLPVPASRWNLENVPTYSSIRGACAAAVQAELQNVALYDHYLQVSLPDDVRATFEYNRRASQENHLPAFRRCVARR